MRTHTPYLLIVAAALLAGCGEGPQPDPSASRTPVVMTTFFPLTYVVQRVGGDDVDVRCPVPPDADPGHWMPADDVVAEYQRADLVVINGAGFEQWVAKVSLPPSRVLDTTAALKDRLLRYEQAVSHSHGPAGAHVHEGVDGHTWLDPVMLLAQAEGIRAALTRLVPERAAAFAERFAALASDLDDLDARLRAAAADYKGPAVYANHPAYNYLAKRYGLQLVNLDLDPSSVPLDAVIEGIRARLEKEPAHLLLWESEPDEAVAMCMRDALSLESVVFTPCESPDAAVQGDFLATMRQSIERLHQALAENR